MYTFHYSLLITHYSLLMKTPPTLQFSNPPTSLAQHSKQMFKIFLPAFQRLRDKYE